MGFFSNLFRHDDVSGTKKYVSISGMVCQNCVNHAAQALEAVPGVKKAKVNLMRGRRFRQRRRPFESGRQCGLCRNRYFASVKKN